MKETILTIAGALKTETDIDLTHYTLSFFRPLSRLRAKTARPCAVCILRRKPCLFFPFIFVGVFKCFFMGEIITHAFF